MLAITPKDGEAIVRHDAFGSMPSMTMPFRIVPRAQVATLQPGSTIDATVDTSTQPWTLRDVRVGSTVPVSAQANALRDVVPVHVGDVVPDTPFVDQTGRPFRFSQLRGQDVVLAFVYTRCQDPTMCPLISAKFHGLQERIGTRPLHLVEVSLDPAYDRPPVLARYGATFGANPRDWTLAVGDAVPTLDFAARFGIAVFPDPDAGLIHTENTVIIGRDGRVRDELTQTSWQPDDVIADIDSSRGEAANPLARSFSGLGDPALVLLTCAAFGYLLFRLTRRIARSAQ